MKKLSEHKWSILGIILFSVLLMMPMLLNPYQENDDTIYHVANVISLTDSIRMHGILGSPILPNLANGFGYASHLLYPPLSHTITAFVNCFFSNIGLSVTQSFQFVHVLVFLLSGITMYEFAYKLSKNKKIAFVSSLIYLSSPYHLSEHYVRDAIAELFVFPFLPMILSGVVSLLEGNKKAFYPLFVIGYVGGILSHFTLMIYFTIFLAIFLLIYYKKVFQREFLTHFSIATFSVLMICLFFLVPMVEYKIHGGIAVFLEGVMSWGVYGTSLWPHEYFPFVHFHDGVTFAFLLPTVILFLITCFQYKHKKLKTFPYAKGFAIMMLCCLFCSTKLFYFDLLPSLLYMIQFAWRLCAFVAIGAAIFAPLCLRNVSNKTLIFLVLLFASFSLIEIHYRCDNEFIHSNEETVVSGAAMGWQHEYLPENAYRNEEYYENRNSEILVKKGSRATILDSNVPNLKFEAKKDSILELPRLYYIGYKLENDRGENVTIYENENGFVEVEIKEDGVYTLTYPGTKLDQISNVLSIVSVFGSILVYFLYLFSKKRIF